jgi:hypothetical protein
MGSYETRRDLEHKQIVFYSTTFYDEEGEYRGSKESIKGAKGSKSEDCERSGTRQSLLQCGDYEKGKKIHQGFGLGGRDH